MHSTERCCDARTYSGDEVEETGDLGFPERARVVLTRASHRTNRAIGPFRTLFWTTAVVVPSAAGCGKRRVSHRRGGQVRREARSWQSREKPPRNHPPL